MQAADGGFTIALLVSVPPEEREFESPWLLFISIYSYQ